ncbi:MAG: sulfinoalanine decarboxylase [Flavobacteriales bacterium]|jgi:sulfinoalanine decarboxylase
MQNLKADLSLFNHIVEQLIEDEKQRPVAPIISVNEVWTKMDIQLQDEKLDEATFEKSLTEIVLATPKTASTSFFNQLFGGRQSKSILGDLLAVMLNNSMYTYKVGGPQIAVEKELLKKSCDLVGYSDKSGGTMPTGGSMSNYMSMLMARDRKDPEAKLNGSKKDLVAYTSKYSHYSHAKNASFCGIGRNNLRYIETNSLGQMCTEDLVKQIKADIELGKIPFYINATAGTTVFGAFDPIAEIVGIAAKFECWLHVDGAYCGSAIFSKKHNHLVKGSHLADSFSYNAHKMLGTPLTCSVLLVKDETHLYQSFSNDADYLYQTADNSYNPGKTSFQCGRRNDALKFWTLWKSVGTEGLESIVDLQFELAREARTYVANHPDYTLYNNEESIGVCFNYKDIPAKDLCNILHQSGKAMVGFGLFNDDIFIRLVTINTSIKQGDLNHFFKHIESLK